MCINWKMITGFSLYEISEYGVVRSIAGHKTTNQVIDSKGYPAVKIKNDAGVYVRERIHSLVYKTFRRKLNNVKGGIFHIDGNVFNNHISNLRLKKYESKAVEKKRVPVNTTIPKDDGFNNVVYLENGDIKIYHSCFVTCENNRNLLNISFLIEDLIKQNKCQDYDSYYIIPEIYRDDIIDNVFKNFNILVYGTKREISAVMKEQQRLMKEQRRLVKSKLNRK